jgi:Sel1 repeat
MNDSIKYNNKKNVRTVGLSWIGVLLLASLLFVGSFAYAQTDNNISTPVEILMAEPLSKTALASSSEASLLFNQAKKYHDGDGVAQDLVRAHSLYLKSASMGNNAARLNLGYLYFMGEGVDQSYLKARNWYLSAASNGSKDAQLNLAMIYQNGFGVPKNSKQAEYWRTYDQVKAIKRKPVAKPIVKSAVKSTVKPVVRGPVKIVDVKKPVKLKSVAIPTQTVKTKESVTKLVTVKKPVNPVQQSKRELPKARSFVSQPLTTQLVERKQGINSTNILEQAGAIPPSKQIIKNAQYFTPKTKESLNAVSDNIATTKPELSVSTSLKPLRGLTRATDTEPQMLSPWFSNIIALFMFMMVVITSLWFFTQFTNIGNRKKARVFARAFYAHHRDRLRVNYLRYPLKHRNIDTIDDTWATTLCVLMVRFAQSQKDKETLVGLQSNKIIQALKESPFKAKQAVFPFVKVTQHRIFDDIQAHEYKFKDLHENSEALPVINGKDSPPSVKAPLVKIKQVLTEEKVKKDVPKAKVKELLEAKPFKKSRHISIHDEKQKNILNVDFSPDKRH